MEYRQKPDNLSFVRENNWRDAFIAYFPAYMHPLSRLMSISGPSSGSIIGPVFIYL
ncbi:MAG TPA: DUF3034 family protein [Gammaproteobacteria bacterium]|nr:DUF3034 family protein [Gammaproteobacteria bacterium]